MDRRVFGQPSAGDQTSSEVDSEVGWTAMMGMHDLRDVFESVDDRLNDRALTQKQLIL